MQVAAVSSSMVGRLPDGRDVLEFCLTNESGTRASILTLGATLRTCVVADASGHFDDIVLGFDTAEEYLRGSDYFGATVGRYANRIANGRFAVGGRHYQLAVNSPPNAEHGGEDGFHRRLWNVEATDITDGAALELSLLSPDGDQGYPGALSVHVTYTLTDRNELRIAYRATTSAATVVNLTNHTYWTLAGAGDALLVRLRLYADGYTPVDAALIPTGEIRSVSGTVFDFRTPQVIASRIRNGSEPQLALGRGYDHNFVLRGEAGALRMAARLEDPRSGRVVELLTTEPGLQLYTGNYLCGSVPGKGGRLYRQGDGIALEPQHFPDSPNHPQFPSTILQPGCVWASTTVYRFGNVARRHCDVG
jgi:aldose 1-epimerase